MSLLNSRWAPGNSNSYNSYNQYGTNSNGNHQASRNTNPRTHSVPAPNASPAPTYSQSQSQSSTLLPPAEELARFMKIVSRLRWKLPFLAEAYRLATIPTNPEDPSSTSEAQIMFKIDFFEYYALLERAIVHLLAVFNITVSSSSSSSSSTRGRPYANNASPSLHRYHANVLSALEEESSPLTPVLGSGLVYEQLRQAKELRNRWKTADMTRDEVLRDPVGDRDVVRPLESYDLEGILSGIFGGLEEGFVRAREHVKLCRRVGEDVEAEREEGWEFMVDAMDWEAV